jgi:putative FmdB family regulatory protein
MPTYQYRCKQCDHELEVVQSFTDDPLETCPQCEGPLRKVYGNVGISFKGSGFYKTDSRSSSRSSSPRSGDADGSDSKGRDSGSGSEPGSPGSSASSGGGSGDGKTDSSAGSTASGAKT